MPRGIPKNPKQHFYLVAGQIEYNEGKEKVQKTALSTGIHVNRHEGINVKGLMNIQMLLQMQFLNHFQKTHNIEETPVQITNVQITSVSYLGAFTEEGFYKETAEEEKETKTEEKKTELKVVENPPAVTEETPVVAEPAKVEEAKTVATADAVTPEPVADKQPLVEVTAQPVEVPPTV